MQHEGLCFHKWFGVSVAKPATHHHPLSFRETGEVILGTYCVLGGVLTVCYCVCGTFTVHTGGVGETGDAVSDPRGKSWLQGACPPL